jgi:hypothetical protein
MPAGGEMSSEERKEDGTSKNCTRYARLPAVSLPLGLCRNRGVFGSFIRRFAASREAEPPCRHVALSYCGSHASSSLARQPRDDHSGHLHTAISSRRILHQKVDHGVKVGLFLGADAIAANLAALYGFEIELFNQLVYCQLLFQI